MAPPRPRPARAHTSLREGSRAGRRRGGARRKSNTEHPTQGNGSRVLPPRPALGKGTSLFAFPEKGSSFLHVGECLVGPKSQRKRWNQYRCLVGPESQRRRWNQYTLVQKGTSLFCLLAEGNFLFARDRASRLDLLTLGLSSSREGPMWVARFGAV